MIEILDQRQRTVLEETDKLLVVGPDNLPGLTPVGLVASVGHNHDSTYAAAGHNHDSAYAAAGHNHDSAYAAIEHSHAFDPVIPGGVIGYMFDDVPDGWAILNGAAVSGDRALSQLSDYVYYEPGTVLLNPSMVALGTWVGWGCTLSAETLINSPVIASTGIRATRTSSTIQHVYQAVSGLVVGRWYRVGVWACSSVDTQLTLQCYSAGTFTPAAPSTITTVNLIAGVWQHVWSFFEASFASYRYAFDIGLSSAGSVDFVYATFCDYMPLQLCYLGGEI